MLVIFKRKMVPMIFTVLSCSLEAKRRVAGTLAFILNVVFPSTKEK
jgi:hypothetical protein